MPVSSFDVLKLDGSNTDLKVMFGRLTVLSFIASWCESCKGQFAELNSLHDQLSEHGGTVLAVAMDDSLPALRSTSTEYNLKFPVVLDSQAKSRRVFKVTGFPETIVLDGAGSPLLLQDLNGNLAIKFIGPRPWTRNILSDQIIPLVKPAA